MNFFAKLFKGRINRRQYLLRFFAAAILFAVIGLIATTIINIGRGSLLYTLLLFPLALYTTSLDYRRLQDLGYPGLFALIKVASVVFFEVAIPAGLPDTFLVEGVGVLLGIMSFLLSIVLIFFPGQEDKNKYGARPK